MKSMAMQELHAAGTSEASRSAVATWREAHHRFRLLAIMVHGKSSALPEAWQSYGTIDTARSGAREMLNDQRVLRVAIIEDRPPLQFVEWVGR